MGRLLLLAALAAVLCTASAQDEAAKLQEVIDDVWAWRLQMVPEFATFVGDHQYDDRLMNYSLAAYDQWQVEAREYLQRLRSLKRDALSDSSKLNYDLLEQMLDTYVTGSLYIQYGALNPINFLEGIHLDAGSWVENMIFVDRASYNTYKLRLRAFVVQVEQHMDLMREAIRTKRTYHNASMYRVPGEIDDLIGANYTQSPFWKPLGQPLDNLTLPEEEKTALRADFEAVIKTEINPKLRALKYFVENDYMPNTRAGVGVNSWENGQAYYQACLKWHLSVDMTPEEVHEVGEQEVERILKEMTKIKDKVGFKNLSLQEFFERTRNDSSHFFQTEQQLLDGYTEIIQEVIKPTLTQMFTDIPDIPVVVKKMPYDGPGGSYSSPSTVNGTGTFYANTRNPETKPKFEMTALCLHEADPGHHMQSTFQLVQDLQLFRRRTDYSKYFNIPFHFPFHTAYTEGWALYAEALGEELKVYRDDYELLGRYSSEIFRACRLVVDTGLHHFNWTQQQAVDYIYTRNTMGLQEIEREIERYMTWPGQACAYKIGEIKIHELRAEAEAELGSNFDLKGFHSVILRLGSSPLDILEQVVKAWVQQQKERFTSSAASARPALLVLLLTWYLNSGLI